MPQATGKLMWGQAGNYDAIDDREVISATVQGAPGVLMPPSLTAGPGLSVLVGPFTVAVPCDDGTVAIATSPDELTITPPAGGPASGSIRYGLWLSADPDAGTWGLDLLTDQQQVGQLGMSLGAITLPQGANLSTQFTMWPSINQMGFLRCFQTPTERRAFYESLDSRPWGPGWGNLTAITNDDTWGYHLDITSPRGRFCEMLWTEKYPRMVQSGQTSVLTGPFGGINNRPFWYPFSEPPAVVATPTTYRPGHIAILEGGVTASGWAGTFYDLTTNAPPNSAYIHYHWVAAGRVTTDIIPA